MCRPILIYVCNPMSIKKLIAALPVLLLFAVQIAIPNTALAQTEMWDTYLSKIGDQPATVLLDMNLILSAPDKRYPYVVITGPQAHKCDQKGMPATIEIDALETILDATGNFLTGLTPKVLAGTVMYNCQRNNYYYVRDTTGIRNAIMRMYNRSFKDYKYSIVIRPDPQWLSYRTFLYPNDETQNWMDNNRIITAMLQEGDSLKKPRTISFAACFNADTARNAFSTFVTGKGYAINKTPSIKMSAAPLCLLFSKVGPIKVDSINVVTAELRNEVKKHNGIYNGWSAPVK